MTLHYIGPEYRPDIQPEYDPTVPQNVERYVSPSTQRFIYKWFPSVQTLNNSGPRVAVERPLEHETRSL